LWPSFLLSCLFLRRGGLPFLIFFTEVVEVSSARWSIERFEHYPAFGKTYAIGQ